MNKLQKQFEEWADNKINAGDGKSYSYLAWLESQLTWRKVEDELPEDGKIVQANHRGKRLFYASYDSKSNEWTEVNAGWRCPDHWLPIPN